MAEVIVDIKYEGKARFNVPDHVKPEVQMELIRRLVPLQLYACEEGIDTLHDVDYLNATQEALEATGCTEEEWDDAHLVDIVSGQWSMVEPPTQAAADNSKPNENQKMIDRLWKRLDDPKDLVAQAIWRELPQHTRMLWLLVKAKQLLRNAEPSSRAWALERDLWTKVLRGQSHESSSLSGGHDQDQGSDRDPVPGDHPDQHSSGS